jgi:hypothetical protein
VTDDDHRSPEDKPRGGTYWQDTRWDEVSQLRDRGQTEEAKNLVRKIGEDWGVEDHAPPSSTC